jgi:serine/threonine-protein kinase
MLDGLVNPAHDFTGDDGDLRPGRQIGPFRIEGLYREGGFASLYRAVRVESGEPVALKVLHPHLVADDQVLERFRLEANTVNQLHHPNIVRVLGCGEVSPDRPFIAMEWLEGRSLNEELATRGPLAPAEALAVMEELCSALSATHARGIVHRDLKAQNVMAIPRAGGFTVKVVDFGMVKLLDRERPRRELTYSSAILGTPLNMAPEQILGQPVDERTDIYALGLLLHQCLTGALPFCGSTAVETEELHLQAPVPRISELVAAPPAIDAVLQRCLDKCKSRRYPSVEELLVDLRVAVASPQVPAETLATMVGVYVQARIAAGLTADELLDDLERVLALARSAMSAMELTLAIESADAVLGVATAPVDQADSARFRRRILEAAVELSDRLDQRPDPWVRVCISAHVATASTRRERGRLVLGGDLLRVRDWATDVAPGGVVATLPMLAGLEQIFPTAAVRLGNWTGQRRAP